MASKHLIRCGCTAAWSRVGERISGFVVREKVKARKGQLEVVLERLLYRLKAVSRPNHFLRFARPFPCFFISDARWNHWVFIGLAHDLEPALIDNYEFRLRRQLLLDIVCREDGLRYIQFLWQIIHSSIVSESESVFAQASTSTRTASMYRELPINDLVVFQRNQNLIETPRMNTPGWSRNIVWNLVFQVDSISCRDFLSADSPEACAEHSATSVGVFEDAVRLEVREGKPSILRVTLSGLFR